MAWIKKVVRKKGDTWKVGWYEDGKARYQSFDDDVEARDYKDEIERSKRLGGYTHPSRGRVPLREWAEDFLKIIRRKRAPSTVATYTHMLRKHVIPTLGRARLDSLRAADIERFLSELEPQVGTATLQSVHKVLARLFRVAVVNDLILKSPMDGIDPEMRIRHSAEDTEEISPDVGADRYPEDREPEALSASQVAVLAGAIHPRFRALVLLLAYSGLRIGEACALRVRDLNLVSGQVQIVRAASIVGGKRYIGPTKNKRRRVVLLPPFLREELAEHLRRFGRPDDRESLVFTSRKGNPINRGNFLARDFYPACDLAGLVPHPHTHDLRHTAASLALNNGGNMKVIQEMLGHASIRTTMDIYAHMDETLQEGIASRLDSVYRDSLKSRSDVVPISRRRGDHELGLASIPATPDGYAQTVEEDS